MTVVHLACGLDTRYQRVRKGANVRWIDVDQPLAVDLRSRLIPQPSGNYTLRTMPITRPGWAEDIPNDVPTLVNAEGLFPYLEPEECRSIFTEIASTFCEGEMHFDTQCSLTQFLGSRIPALRSSKAVLEWGTDDLRGDVEAAHPKLKLKDQKLWAEYNGTHRPVYGELLNWLASWTPSYKRNICLNRFNF